MKVLVTGARGIIGRRAVRHLTDSGADVVPLADGIDAGDESAVGLALEGCAAVVHLAALAHPSLGTPRQVFTNNVVSTFTVLAQAATHGVPRVVVASSVNASGVGLNPALPMPAYFPLDEALPADIADAYSLSKTVDELSAGMAARAWGTTVVALRFPLVKSLPELASIAAEVDPASMMRTGWAYLTDSDAARAVTAALTAPLAGAHVIGLSAADTLLPMPTQSLVDTYAPGVACRRLFTGREALVDTTRARELLGFTPTESLDADHRG
ncbi:MAG: NAD(P)-dependent oxidoreductase [Kibdelosporangium sp.]